MAIIARSPFTSKKLREAYRRELRKLPPRGAGCHPQLWRIALLGFAYGIPREQVEHDLRKQTEINGGKVPAKEIAVTVARAYGGAAKEHREPPKAKIDGSRTFASLVEKGRGVTEADFFESSPVRLFDSPEADHVLLLETLYQPSEILFIGLSDWPGILGNNIATVSAWLHYFRTNNKIVNPFIIPNSLTGELDENYSLRGDGCVSRFRFAVLEFDKKPRGEQLAFFSQVNLPFCALIDTGGKSIHGWIEVEGVSNAEQWTENVERDLFGGYLIPLGADPLCRNEARLSRLPGAFRKETGKFQKLLWLSPKGKKVFA